MTMRARFFAKGDRRWLCAPWSRSMFFHLMKYGGEPPPPPQPTARASHRCAAARAGLGCRRVATNHAKAKPENLRDGQRPPWNLFKARQLSSTVHGWYTALPLGWLPQFYTCTLHGLVFFLYVPCLATIILRFSPGSSTSPYSRAKSQILTPMCCYGFLLY